MKDKQTFVLGTLTGNMEQFCQGIADGLNQTAAYKAGYDAKGMKSQSISNEASKLKKMPKVARRIQELKQSVADGLTAERIWNLERGMDEIETNLRLSRYLGQMSSARSSTRDGLQLSGLLAERPQIEESKYHH